MRRRLWRARSKSQQGTLTALALLMMHWHDTKLLIRRYLTS
jgi:hypothetical protein